ncbi:MAG TPA: hypothetical protein VF242_05600 [Nitrososphaeraceae archaeon]
MSPVHSTFTPAIPLADIDIGGGGSLLQLLFRLPTDIQLMHQFQIRESQSLLQE